MGYDKTDFEFCIEMMEQGRIDPRPMVTDVIGLDAVPEAFEALKTPSNQCKVLISLD